MKYVLVGMNHKTAPVEIREKMALDQNGQVAILSDLLNSPFIEEATILSTCNRVEFYGLTHEPKDAQNHLKEVLSKPLNNNNTCDDWVYCKSGFDVVKHLFEVTSSLDSQVIGENQILGQVKEAYQVAQNSEATGYYLNNLFNRALHVAKKVKTQTDISKGNVSIGSVSVLLAKKIFGSLRDKSILMFGAGEIGKLVIRYLKTESVNKSYIINRTFYKAKELEQEHLGEARSQEDLYNLLKEVDVLITCVSETVKEFSHESVVRLMEDRKNQPLFVIDLGVPRNFQEDMSSIPNFYLYNIDDLKDVAEENKDCRSQSLKQAKNIIDHEVRLFYEKHFEMNTLPTIGRLGKKFELIRQMELDKSLSKMPHLASKDRDQIDKLTQALINRVLYDPILSLKNHNEMSEPGSLALFKKLFRLDDEK